MQGTFCYLGASLSEVVFLSEFDFLDGFFRFFIKMSPLLLWSLLEMITSESSSEPKILRLTFFFLPGKIKCCTSIPSCYLYMFLIIYSDPKRRNSDDLMIKKLMTTK